MHKRFPPLLLGMTLLLSAAGHADGFRDPMRPAGSAPAPSAVKRAAPNTLKLEGVITSGATRVAIVNGRLARPGDIVAGAHILKILPDGILYMRAGRKHSLLLPGTRASANVRVARSLEATKP